MSLRANRPVGVTMDSIGISENLLFTLRNYNTDQQVLVRKFLPVREVAGYRILPNDLAIGLSSLELLDELDTY
jgi:hypothetical protein